MAGVTERASCYYTLWIESEEITLDVSTSLAANGGPLLVKSTSVVNVQNVLRLRHLICFSVKKRLDRDA